MLKTALKIDWGLDLPPLLYRMWLTLAKRVAVTVFMKEPHFEVKARNSIIHPFPSRHHLFLTFTKLCPATV